MPTYGVTHEFIDLQYDAGGRPASRASQRICARGRSRPCATASSCCCCSRPLPRAAASCRARAARHRRGAPPSRAHGPALRVQPARRDRHRARPAPLRLPDRLRRHGGVSVPGLPDAVRHDAHAAACKLEYGERAWSSAAATARASARACSRSCRRWASRTIASYRGAQLFEIVGLRRRRGRPVLPRHAQPHRAARTSRDLRGRPASSSRRAPGTPREPIEQGGLLKYVHGGEYHMYNPDVVATLQARGAHAATTSDYQAYRAAGERAAGCRRCATCCS